jgi:ribosomal protein L4
MQDESDFNGLNFGKNKRQLIRIRGSNELDKKRESLLTPSREENNFSRNMNSRRAASRNSRQAMKPTVNWVRGGKRLAGLSKRCLKEISNPLT